MSRTSIGNLAVRTVIDEVAAAIRRNPQEFTGGLEKVTLTVHVNPTRIEILHPRVLVGAPAKRAADALLGGEIEAVVTAVRTKMLAVAPAEGLPKQFIIDIYLRGPRPHVEITVKA